ncbi:MAG: HAD-IIB family hydrolase [Actinomycetaceae bacterium]|nr:HAD-IIB family hydrolase [Actinomycetaceae bacterium]
MQLVAFDLDDTLAPSKSPLPAPMARALAQLMDLVPVCIISGGQFQQFQTQVLDHLPASVNASALEGLHLMPTCGTRYVRYQGGAWLDIYAHNLTSDQRARAIKAVKTSAEKLGLWEAKPYGEIIEDRGSQITFSALGQEAPLEAKRAWDPDGSKKNALRQATQDMLEDLEVRSGGSTSVDITVKGIDKAYGMNILVERTGIAPEHMLFIGDRLDVQGNDYPVVSTGIACVATSGWEQTVDLIETFIQQRG